MTPVVLVLVALVAVVVVVVAFRLDERRLRTGQGLWSALRDLREPLPGEAPPRRRSRWLITLLPVLVLVGVLAAAVVWSGGVDPTDADSTTRDDGDERVAEPPEPVATDAPDAPVDPSGTPVEVAVEHSRLAFPDGGAEHVLLTREQPSVDALAAGGLQGLLGGPLLLTASDRLSPETAEEIERLGSPSVHVLGGEDAVSADVERELVAAGHDVHRDAGPRGIDTAAAVAAAHFPAAETAVVAPDIDPASGPNEVLAQALTAGGLAAAEQIPILLTSPGALSATTSEHLAGSSIRTVVVIGTESEVGTAVVDDLESLGLDVVRLGGADRYATAAAVAQSGAFASAREPAAVLADGTDAQLWPGLAVAALDAGRHDAPVLLSDGAALPEATRAALEQLGTGAGVACMPAVDESACVAAQAVPSR